MVAMNWARLLLLVIISSFVIFVSTTESELNKDPSSFDAQQLDEDVNDDFTVNKRNYQHIWRNVADRMNMNPRQTRFVAGGNYDGEENAMSKRNYQHIWRNVADRMNPQRFASGNYNGEENAMSKRNYQHIWRNVADRMNPQRFASGNYDGEENAMSKRNYQHIWRNVAQRMPFYVSEIDAEGPIKRNYQYIWRNVAEKMPKSRVLRSFDVF